MISNKVVVCRCILSYPVDILLLSPFMKNLHLVAGCCQATQSNQCCSKPRVRELPVGGAKCLQSAASEWLLRSFCLDVTERPWCASILASLHVFISSHSSFFLSLLLSSSVSLSLSPEGVPVNSRVSSKIQQLLNTLKRPKRPPLREFFLDDFEELLDGRLRGNVLSGKGKRN